MFNNNYLEHHKNILSGLKWRLKEYDLSLQEINKINKYLDDVCTDEDYRRFQESKHFDKETKAQNFLNNIKKRS
jgi:CTP:molybdopterin cytidylyltransferase MocA